MYKIFYLNSVWSNQTPKSTTREIYVVGHDSRCKCYISDCIVDRDANTSLEFWWDGVNIIKWFTLFQWLHLSSQNVEWSFQDQECQLTGDYRQAIWFCQAQGPTLGPTQGRVKVKVRKWSGHGQVRSDSNSNANSKVGPELYTKIGFHPLTTTHPPPLHL